MRSVYLEIQFFSSCFSILLCPVLSALSAQQDTSVSCAQVACSLLSKIGTHMVQFLTLWHQKNNKTLVTRTLSDWQPLEKVTHRFSSRYETSRLWQEWKHTFLMFAAEPVFGRSNFDCNAQRSLRGSSSSRPFTPLLHECTELAQVFLLSYGCGKITQDCTCTSAVLFGVRWKHLFFCHPSPLSSLWLSFSGRSEAGFGSVGGQV